MLSLGSLQYIWNLKIVIASSVVYQQCKLLYFTYSKGIDPLSKGKPILIDTCIFKNHNNAIHQALNTIRHRLKFSFLMSASDTPQKRCLVIVSSCDSIYPWLSWSIEIIFSCRYCFFYVTMTENLSYSSWITLTRDELRYPPTFTWDIPCWCQWQNIVTCIWVGR